MKKTAFSGLHLWQGSGETFPVFIVDDDVMFLHALAFHLKKDMRMKVYCYSSVEDCLCNLRLEPRAIVLDYAFDKKGADSISGKVALKVIRALKPAIPVIMLSAQQNMSISFELLESGAYTYIVKNREALVAVEKTLFSLARDPGTASRHLFH